MLEDAIRSTYYKQILVILIPLMLTADKGALLGLVGIKWCMFTCKVFLTLAILIHSWPMFHFYTPLKYQNTGGFLRFSWSIEVEHCWKWVNVLESFLRIYRNNFFTWKVLNKLWNFRVITSKMFGFSAKVERSYICFSFFLAINAILMGLIPSRFLS